MLIEHRIPVAEALRDGADNLLVIELGPVLERAAAMIGRYPPGLVAEGGGWAAFLPGLPVHGDGPTFEEAVEDLLEALREYADDWNARLLDAPNHREHWAVVELTQLASDDELRAWLLAAEPTA